MNDFVHVLSGEARASAAEERRVVGRVVMVSGARVTGLLYRADSPKRLCGGVRIGALVRMRTQESDVFGIVVGLRVNDPALLPEDAEGMVEVELLCEVMDDHGEGGAGTFKRGVSVYPDLGTDIVTATREELASVYARPDASNVRILTSAPMRTLPRTLFGLSAR